MTSDPQSTRESICAELSATHASFHSLLDSLSREDLPKQRLNPGWTNGEIQAHMTLPS